MAIYRKTDASAAVAFELCNHIDDLVDSGITTLELPGGDAPVGELADTQFANNDSTFLVALADGRKVRVTCEEVQ